MANLNLSEWALKHRVLMLFCMVLAVLAGVRAFFFLGQNEDPEYTVKTMVVRAYLPGAGMDETIMQLTDRLEKKLQETPYLEHLKSYTRSGETTIFVSLYDSTPKKEVPECWYQVRKKTGDLRRELPSETLGPYFDDEFGETYGIIYALTAQDFSHRELKDQAETLRNELLRVPDVAKITVIGAQNEHYYVEFSPRRLASLGLSREAIAAALQKQNALTPSGRMDTGLELLELETGGGFKTVGDLADISLYAGTKKVRLGDLATIRHMPSDPPEPIFRYNGQDAVGLGISMRKGGDVLKLEKNMDAAMAGLSRNLPAGMAVHLVSNQPKVVRQAVAEFMRALFEAVAIVLGISFLSLGMRAGTVVACSIPLVLALVFVGMEICGIDLQRVSLGALIISLGLLVDDAMITVENMVSRLEQGWPIHKAATYAYTATAFPMLTGTLVTILGFIPIGLGKSSAGEYCFSLFAVVGMALLFSWFVAVLFAPVIGVRVLHEKALKAGFTAGRVGLAFRRALLAAMRRPKTTAALCLLAFLTSLAAFPLVPQQFFPPSERPELMVDMTLRQGVAIGASNAASKRFDALLAQDSGVLHWSSYVGRGAIRFYLPLDEQLQNDFFAQTVVVTKGEKAREQVRERLQQALDRDFPELTGRVYTLEMGPPVGWPIQYRVSGPELGKVQDYARRLAALMAQTPELEHININWGEKARKLRIRVRQDEARRIGLSSAAIAQTLYTTVNGVSVTQVRDGIYLEDVVLRADGEARANIEDLQTLGIPLPGGQSVPLSAVADIEYTQDYPLVWRRDRQPTATVQAGVPEDIMPDTLVKRLRGRIEALQAELPPGYRLEPGGTVEESAKARTSVIATLPVMVLLMLFVLMVQLENWRHLVLVVCVAPLGITGVVIGLLLTRQPMGFVALLGVVALVGMIIRNSVILVHQIDQEKLKGRLGWDAVHEAACIRFRPIMLTAVAAILGMLPIAPTTFWGPMAIAVMGGLALATAFTLLFLPACYVLWFGLQEPKIGDKERQTAT